MDGIAEGPMKLIRFDTPGPPDVLQCLDVPVPEPKAGEVLIRAHAIGVGMPDVMIRAGTYTHMPPLPATPGTEIAGTIEKVGAGVGSAKKFFIAYHNSSRFLLKPAECAVCGKITN